MEKITLKKDEKISTFNILEGKVLTTLKVGDNMISNPPIQMLYDDGWEDYTPPTPEVYEPSRDELIHAEIREKYSEADELKILRRYSANPHNEEYREAFEEYNLFVESVITKHPEE